METSNSDPCSSSSSSSLTFSLRIVSIDFYMAPPIKDLDISYSSFQGGKVNEVPVIRIYGSTPAGQKTCLHVHRALPYLYLPCSDISLCNQEEGERFTRDMAHAIEKALTPRLKGSIGFKRQHVHGCSLVRGKKFYGYHSSEELFLKIYLYHPHEVTRVATLLLDGVILDKSFQPHESHIPYLLQFLVDYNLFGMGHLHTSKVKLRHPLPDIFIPRVSQRIDIQEKASDKGVSVDYQADSSADKVLSSPIWTSSTIPSVWMWSPPSMPDGSPEHDLHLIKRQSTCELEGDATVDEILNLQFKMFSPLSQTQSEVKMVQSLVPIWEEEYQRTGMQEEMLYSDLSKPHPGDVLNFFSNGSEFKDALLDLCKGDGKSSSSQASLSEEAENFMQSIKSLTDVGNLGEVEEQLKPNCSKGESFSCSEERNRNGSMLSQGFSELVPNDEETQTFGKTETSNLKGIDIEALGLLRWLASSQAAEDINSDDDLLPNVILTPLLPKTAINDVLEKANLDYEHESQQECQDILDSVDDTTCSDILKVRAAHSNADNNSPESSTKKVVPQVDGSAEEDFTAHIGDPSQIEVNNKTETSGTCLTGKRKQSNNLWGSLPFVVQQQVNDDQRPTTFISPIASEEIKSGNCSGFSSETKVDGGSGNEICTATTGGSDLKERRESGCSVRDLMRRKRYLRVEPSEEGACRVKKLFVGKEQETSVSPKRLDFYTKQSDCEAMIPNSAMKPSVADQHGVSHEKSSSCESMLAPKATMSGFHDIPDNVERIGSSVEFQRIPMAHTSLLRTETLEVPKFLVLEKPKNTTSTILSKCCKVSGEPDKNDQEGFSAVTCEPDGGDHNTNVSNDADVPQSEKSAFEGQHVPTSLSCPDNSLMSVVMNETKPTKCIEMTFSKKPPAVDWMDATCEAGFFEPDVQNNNPLGHVGKSESTFVWNTNATEVPPFFSYTVQDANEVHKSYKDKVFNFRQDAVLGVPTLYQNDGSSLYLLTTKYSPPSVDSVKKWLEDKHHQYDDTGTSTKCFSSLAKPPSPKRSNSLSLVDKENNTLIDAAAASDPLKLNLDLVLVDASHESLPVSGSVVHAKPILDQLTPENRKNIEKENSDCHRGVTTAHNGKGVTAGASTCTENWQDLSQISGPDKRSKLTPLSQVGFRDPASVGAGQQLTLMSVEVQAASRGDLRPDPRFDAITFIAIVVQEDSGRSSEIFVLLHGTDDDLCSRSLDGTSGCKVVAASEEKHLFDHFVKIIRTFDPDMLMGWEIQGGSLGYLAERAAVLGVSLLNNISRTPSSEAKVLARNMGALEEVMPNDLQPEVLVADPVMFGDVIIEDEWGRTHASGVHVNGRIVLNIWRLMRSEVKLNMYTIEAVAEEVLRRKVPSIPFKILTQWFESGPGKARFRCIEYVVGRANLNLEIMSQLDLINRTSELARVFGIDFFSVLSRGSQYRVESMLLRLAHTQNYLAISPGSQQVASQPAMECLPLVMEPESGFYPDPVVVLDFQSLYPSMIIAYNLCFCTCLGKVVPSKANTLGVTSFSPDPHLLKDLKDEVLLTPNGVMYVPSKVRKGVLPRLLEEILSTRIMVKRAMKKLELSQQVLSRIFNARQLALKLIANVTYGYTAAGFSGRMPCAELADSIVQCGRRTLERAISFVNSHDKWKARVIYGDTDSMFVLLKGRTMKEAYRVGQEIASEITSMNPDPVTLKMEKVYHPCFLLTKKRYVGYSYESPEQAQPVFDAKGIETVRRDSCGAVSKTLEKSLRLFFEHQDISKVKLYLERQWTRILSGRVSLQDFVFAKEVRLGTYSTRASSLPPAAIVAMKGMRADPRAEPRYAERIPYIVIHGEPGARLVDMVVDPLDLLATGSPFRLNDIYYINKQIIPALQRVFGLVGADLNRWFTEMPRPIRQAVGKQQSYTLNAQKMRIDFYYLSKHCFLCGELVQASSYFCDKCCKKGPVVATAVVGRTLNLEKNIEDLASICRHCGGGDWIVESGVKCTSLSCELFYQRRKVQKELQTLSAVATELGLYPKCMVEWL